MDNTCKYHMNLEEERTYMGNPHVLVIPYQAQGHIIPLMELSQCLVKHGFKVTFVNTEFNHKRVVDALAETDCIGDQICLVSIPDGSESLDGKKDNGRLTEAMLTVMPRKLEELIKEINSSDSNKITCVIADQSIGWALEVAAKMGIRRVAFCPAAAAMLIMGFSIPKLIEDGIIDSDGTPIKNQTIQLLPNMPAMNTEKLVWACIGNLATQKIFFELMVNNNKAMKIVDRLICNTFYDLEPEAFTMAPQIIPIGPLLASNQLGSSAGFFWPEDSTCTDWLDQQSPCSVIYIAFGSSTVLDQTKFQELALGLELSNRPFLWVVPPDINNRPPNVYPKGFKERVANCGKIVGGAPQQKVLGHPSVACFLGHCGWNSTMEAVSNGVPLLCWPQFADQFINQSYICDVWKVGLGINQDGRGIITRDEIKNKVDQLLGNEKFKVRALDLKELAMRNVRLGGCSYKNLKHLVEWMKA